MAIQSHASPNSTRCSMNITFRTDASLHIGTGHVMRCLTLADALAARGVQCQFICRQHEGNLIDLIRSKGYTVHALASEEPQTEQALPLLHSHWLGASQAQDAAACAAILAGQVSDWLVVDHYALDTRWEAALAPYYRKLMVIDDLADRHHACDLLLDQTFGRLADDYHPLVPSHCQLLCGSAYALLRPEFSALRPYSLQRRAQPALRHLLISMGGVDKDNVTTQVLQALRHCPLPADCHITIVMGSTAPWLNSVRDQAQSLPWTTTVLVGVNHMAQLMADSDLAIGAAGATSWERCCLGLPTIMLVLAENQREIAKGLSDFGAAHLAEIESLANPNLIPTYFWRYQELQVVTDAAAAITDGTGAAQVTKEIIEKALYANKHFV